MAPLLSRCSSQKGADVGSDHHVVVAVIRLKLRSVGQKNLGHRRYDVDKLKDQEVRGAFVLQVKKQILGTWALWGGSLNHWSHKRPGEPQMEQIHVATVSTPSNKACLGFRQRKIKEWMTPDSWSAVEASMTRRKRWWIQNLPGWKQGTGNGRGRPIGRKSAECGQTKEPMSTTLQLRMAETAVYQLCWFWRVLWLQPSRQPMVHFAALGIDQRINFSCILMFFIAFVLLSN